MNNEKKLLGKPKTLFDFYNVKQLSQIIEPEILRITAAGFTGIIDSPITIVEPKENGSVNKFEGSNITDYLPKECETARSRDGGRACMRQRRSEMKEFIDNPEASPICYCYDKGIHLRKPIIIGGKVVALALGGGYRIENEPSMESIRDYIEYLGKVLSLTDKKRKRSAFSGSRIEFRKHDGSHPDENSCKEEYNRFADKVKAIEKLGEEVFQARRLAREGAFLSQLFGLTKFSYTTSTREEEFKEMFTTALKTINEFCGFNKSVLLISAEERGSFKPFVSVGFPKGGGTSTAELQMDKDWRNFVRNERIAFMANDLDINRLPRSLFSKGEYDIVRLFEDIKVLMQAPKAHCSFAYPVAVVRDYKGMFIFTNEFREELYVERSFRETKTFLDRVMEHLSTILRRHHAQIVSRIFFDRLSHEILAPVGALRNRAEFLKKRYKDLKDNIKDKKLDDLLKECDRLVRLTEGFSIVTDRKKEIKLHKKGTHFYNEIVQPLVYLSRPEADLKGISVSYGEMSHLPRLYVDPDRVKQILNNLILNAIKYSYERTKIDIFYETTPEGYVVCIRNFGIGIPESEDKKIFKSGERGSNASEIDARGSGQGLTICEELIEAHGGKIWFERGKTENKHREIIFKVQFPLALEKEGKNG